MNELCRRALSIRPDLTSEGRPGKLSDFSQLCCCLADFGNVRTLPRVFEFGAALARRLNLASVSVSECMSTTRDAGVTEI